MRVEIENTAPCRANWNVIVELALPPDTGQRHACPSDLVRQSVLTLPPVRALAQFDASPDTA
ncbi:hypothetical protein EI613_08600 [Azospirillum sp. 412522]|nr:hypothetical protein [Azospirillum sp. 412522]MBY6261983.1 hypothetical protein [Azospirillum sp. 412522]